jgi:hypothetical protein
MRTTGKRRMATALLLATGTIAFLPSPAFAICSDPAGDSVDWSTPAPCDQINGALTGATLTNANLTGVIFDSAVLTGANLAGANATSANFVDANLTPGTSLDAAIVDGAIFTRVDGTGATMTALVRNDALSSPEGTNTLTFTDATFPNADFTGAALYDASFLRADLTNANFTNADLRNTELVGANMAGAIFTGANVSTGTNFMFTPDGSIAPDAATTPFETAVTIDVVANDENFNGTAFGQTFKATNVSTPANGVVTVEADGKLTYTPATGFSGIDTYTYTPESELPAAWNLPAGVDKIATGAAVTVTITVQEEGTPPPPETDPILSAAYQGKAGIEGRIARLYAAYFGRDPDTAGFDFWKARIAAGDWTNDNAATFFSQSDEFVAAYGANLTNEQFIDLVYQNVLGRAGDAEGRAFWLGKLDSGSSRGTVMLQFSDSAEFRTRTKTT